MLGTYQASPLNYIENEKIPINHKTSIRFDILAIYIVYYEHEERENGHDSLHTVTHYSTGTHHLYIIKFHHCATHAFISFRISAKLTNSLLRAD